MAKTQTCEQKLRVERAKVRKLRNVLWHCHVDFGGWCGLGRELDGEEYGDATVRLSTVESVRAVLAGKYSATP